MVLDNRLKGILLKVNQLFALMVILLSGPLSGCLVIHEGGVPRIEDLELSSPSLSPIETTLTVKQTIDIDENLILLSPKNTRRLQDKMTSFLNDAGQVKIVSNAETATHMLDVQFKEVTHHNELWAIVAVSTLFIIPYHGSNAYFIEASLSDRKGVLKKYQLKDGTESWGQILLAPFSIFRWPRTVQNVQDNMLRGLAIEIASDLKQNKLK